MFVILPFDRATTPMHRDTVHTDHYWMTSDKGLYFWKSGRGMNVEFSPQCNTSKEITLSLQKKLKPDAVVKFMPVVYIPCSGKYFIDKA